MDNLGLRNCVGAHIIFRQLSSSVESICLMTNVFIDINMQVPLRFSFFYFALFQIHRGNPKISDESDECERVNSVPFEKPSSGNSFPLITLFQLSVFSFDEVLV